MARFSIFKKHIPIAWFFIFVMVGPYKQVGQMTTPQPGEPRYATTATILYTTAKSYDDLTRISDLPNLLKPFTFE